MNTFLTRGAQAPVHLSLSTNTVTPSDRVDFWRHVIGEKIVSVNFQVDDGQPFSAGIEWAKIGELQVSDLRCSRHVAECGRAMAARDNNDTVIFNLIRSGTGMSTQDGHLTTLTPGTGVFCVSSRPFTLEFREDAHLTVLQIPRAALSRNVASFDRVANHNLARNNHLFPLVTGYIEHLVDVASGMTPIAAERVSSNLIELVSAMVAESMQQSSFAMSECRAATLIRLRTFVENHIGDPELGPARVASALGLSQRYINKLLEAEDTSLGRLIWRRRLELIAADLRNGGMLSRSISTIALTRGFNDLAHFSKSFRKHYGMSPREYRAEAVGRTERG